MAFLMEFRRIYAVTEAGVVALSHWMSVIEDEHELLNAMTKRYDSMLDRDITQPVPPQPAESLLAPGRC
ncbi:MAG: hypothetical protein LC749_18080 [Actinobacteria bacterium]|nr:hypothetical protein [Actinomycetota bacterium]